MICIDFLNCEYNKLKAFQGEAGEHLLLAALHLKAEAGFVYCFSWGQGQLRNNQIVCQARVNPPGHRLSKCYSHGQGDTPHEGVVLILSDQLPAGGSTLTTSLPLLSSGVTFWDFGVEHHGDSK